MASTSDMGENVITEKAVSAACVIMCNQFLVCSAGNTYFCTVRTTNQIVEPFKKKKEDEETDFNVTDGSMLPLDSKRTEDGGVAEEPEGI